MLTINEMFKLALANASRHVLLRSKVLEEVVGFYNVMLRMSINITKVFYTSFMSMNNAMGKLQGRGIVCKF